MVKEVIISVNSDHVQAFCKAVEGNPHIRGLNPHIATRFRISEQLTYGAGEVRLSALANGGPINVRINGEPIEEGGVMTRLGLESVVNVYRPGEGARIASSILSGAVLVLRRA
ncbi:MAG: hypothetical protein UU34_C0004G0031 [Candidatus Curtissbacteria bacterium GW2011_GWA1_41_11]|uniref:Uncharacterized protein n=1 Tax=Candidatus Curtissbacteria bacterium GW2011_GWA1_41_11 TaxID=1618409 RepID=A0A0G0WSR1_9BACT|nr:MAG: hypothetical protein UU34_C0004G0031 [Candidatus Curtissbacteria bacterium GW2011_GWA1_41_11]